MMANLNLPEKSGSRQIASAVSLVVQISRFNDGTRRVTHMTEITGMEDDVVSNAGMFSFSKSREWARTAGYWERYSDGNPPQICGEAESVRYSGSGIHVRALSERLSEGHS